MQPAIKKLLTMGFSQFTVSRHMVVCHVAQEASAPHLQYIGRKKENVIFHTYVAPRTLTQIQLNLLQRCPSGRRV